MKNKFLIFVFGILIFLTALGVVSAANSGGFLQIWRNASTGTNVTTFNNNGNIFTLGNINISGTYYGDGSGLTNLNVSALNLSDYIPYTGSSKNVVLGDYNFSVGTSDFFVNSNTNNVGIGTTSPNAKLEVTANSDANVNIANFLNSGQSTAGRYTYLSFGKSRANGGAASFGFVEDTVTPANSWAYFGTPYGQSETTKSLVVANSGNVGIGTTSPVSKLNIFQSDGGAITLSRQGDNNNDLMGKVDFYQTRAGYEGTIASIEGRRGDSGYTRGDLAFLTKNASGVLTENMRMTYAGKVGIGMVSPGARLSVAGVTQITGFSNPTSGAGLEMGYDATEGIIQVYNRDTPGGKPLWLNYGVGNVILGGNVGIGTTGPNSKLEVFGSAVSSGNSDILTINTNSVSTGRYGSLTFRESDTNIGARITSGNAGSYTGFLAFETSRQFSAGLITTEAIRIDGSGNVGIGTTTPNAKLHVNGSAIINGTLIGLSNATDLTGAVTLAQLQSVNTTLGNYVPYTGSNQNVVLGAYNLTVDTSTFFVNSNTNNVGIGTTSPSYKLDVNGTANAYDFKINGTSALTSETNWNANYSTFLTHITWANVMNGTLALNSTFGNYFTKSDILGFSYYNSTTLPSRVSGSGTAWYIPMWNGTTSLNNSVIFQNGSNIGIGTTIPTSKLEVAGTFNATSNGGTLQVDSSGNVNIGL